MGTRTCCGWIPHTLWTRLILAQSVAHAQRHPEFLLMWSPSKQMLTSSSPTSSLAQLVRLCLLDQLRVRHQLQARHQAQLRAQVIVQEVPWMHALISAQLMSLPSVSSLARGVAKVSWSDLTGYLFAGSPFVSIFHMFMSLPY